jgi:hypothetical protein
VAQVTIYYLNGDAASRTATVSVNGGAPSPLTFPAKGTWASPQLASVTLPMTLNAGANTLLFSNPSAFAPDLDRISVTK